MTVLPGVIPSTLDRNLVIGSTDARIIASGMGWLDLYLQKIGEKKREDLSHVWRVQLGMTTEKLHAWWHQLSTGDAVIDSYDDTALTRAGLPEHHACKIDRVVMPADGGPNEVLETKHTNERNNLRDAATYYMAQLQWQMHVLDLASLRFSIIRGNNEPEWGMVTRDQGYIDQLVKQVDAFWWHVTEKEAPEADPPAARETAAALKKAAAAVPLNGFKPYDMTGNNEWADAAPDFIRDKAGAEGLKASEARIRGLIPDDAETVTGHGLSFKRDARGAYRVTIEEDELAYWRRRFAEIKGERAG